MPVSTSVAETQWINGQPVPSRGTETLQLLDPSDGSSLAEVPRGCAADADAAVQAARAAGRAWADLAPGARASLLREAAQKLRECRDEVAYLLTRENGKPLAQAGAEVDGSIALIHATAELGVHLSARHLGSPAGELVFQCRQPRGVSACLSTWNAPVFASVELAACNLIVGNTVVLKSSEKTPLATRFLVERAFGHLPAGILNHLCGDGPSLGDPLIRHPEVAIVCFIGSVQVGRHIGRVAGERIHKAVLELGGKDALIIDDTVDIVSAARLAARCAFANSGQICTSTERIYVLRDVYEPFVEQLARAAQSLRVGPGLDPASDLGPLIDAGQLVKVDQHVQASLCGGACAVTGGARLDRPGFYYPPTVLTGVNDEMAVMSDETFGPIAPVVPVDSFEEAIERANRSEYGLSAIVFTESAPRAILAIERLQAGMIKINCERGQAPGAPAEPVKNSGIGIGHGIEFLCELTTTKSVHWRSRLRTS